MCMLRTKILKFIKFSNPNVTQKYKYINNNNEYATILLVCSSNLFIYSSEFHNLDLASQFIYNTNHDHFVSKQGG